MKYAILGNGIAGVCAAEAIRQLDQEGEILMVGDESFPPYSRPMISYVLDGSQPYEKLPIRPASFYDSLKIKPVLGQRAVGIDVKDHRVRLADSTSISYDRLLIASGADPRPVRAEGRELGHIFYLRTERDVRQQLAALAGARRALVLGGGLVGLKAAYALLRRGLEVTLLITSEYPLSQQVDEIAGKMVLDELVRRGLKVLVGVSVRAFEGNSVVQAAVTDAGSRVPCDMVIIGKGVLPARDFIPKEQILVDLGVVVDDHLQSSAEGIYAAGDVAESVDISRGRRWVNALWPEAAVQGRIAGFNMAGRPVSYAGSMSRNVLRVYDLDVLTLGNANPDPAEECRVVRTGGPGKGRYRSLVLKDDVLIGAVLINQVEQGGVLRALMENRVPIRLSASRLMAPDFNFAWLLP